MKPDLEARFCKLYRDYYFYVFKKAFAFFHEQATSHDIAQEAFYKLYVAVDKGKEAALDHRYLVRIATNLCIDKVRAYKRGEAIPLDEAAIEYLHVFNGVASIDRGLRIDELFTRLPDDLQAIAIYRYVDGYTLDEVALVSGIPKRTVQRRLDMIKSLLTGDAEPDHDEP